MDPTIWGERMSYDPSTLAGSWHRTDPIDYTDHTMGAALMPYLQLKVHSLVQRHDWRRIYVIGDYNRKCRISALEKNDKMFNWHRPTASVIGDELIVRCYPGQDYVFHYALIVATFLSMDARWRGQVFYRLPEEGLCEAAVHRFELDVTRDDVVILGWGVQHLAGESAVWISAEGYAWTRRMVHGATVLYVGFLHSIWGDVAGRLVTRLVALGARRIVYVGKVGTLDPSLPPNSLLATGCESLVRGRRVRWLDFFDGVAAGQPNVIVGSHVTSPSTLVETRGWLAGHDKSYSFVDPEIGRMGEVACSCRILFGYLHVISNNLARHYEHDLSNERTNVVMERRRHLLEQAKQIISTRLETLDQLPSIRRSERSI
jgi:hypothetical protein